MHWVQGTTGFCSIYYNVLLIDLHVFFTCFAAQVKIRHIILYKLLFVIFAKSSIFSLRFSCSNTIFFYYFVENYPCPTCARVYRHATSRMRHIKYECGKMPTFKCPAQNCLYKARRKSTLKVHVIHKHGEDFYALYIRNNRF